MKPYKVLFFDSWKGGLVHFTRLVASLAANNIEPLLVHLGSWGNEAQLVLEERIDGLKIRDIAYYENSNFDAIIEAEKPDLVLFLSCNTFAHRAVQRYCRKLGIPTILLMHGLTSLGYDAVAGENSCGKPTFIAYLKIVLSKLPKMIRFTLPCYMRALYQTKATTKEWFDFLKNIYFLLIDPMKAAYMTEDSKTDKCLVYTEADKGVLSEVYGFDPINLIEVGNPDLIRFHVGKEMIAASLEVLGDERPYVMYIDTAFALIGMFFHGPQGFIQHMLETKNALHKQGKKLFVKLHPMWRYKTKERLALEAIGIELVDNNDFVTALQKCCAVISEPSSLALLPALIGMPLFLARYGDLRGMNYGTFYTSYPRAMLLEDLNRFTAFLENEKIHLNHSVSRQWIEKNIGLLPAEEMPNRVVKNIKTLIMNKEPMISVVSETVIE